MISFNYGDLVINIPSGIFTKIKQTIAKFDSLALILLLTIISVSFFSYFYFNGLGVAYNDARSHLDIGRRVVEGLKPGLAQLGSVWLPLSHILMVPFVWNDWLWHSGLAGAITSMVSFILTGFLIYRLLKILGINWLGRLAGVGIFAINLNVLYLQSTAMTELLLILTSTASAYFLILWAKNNRLFDLISASFCIFLAILTRYDGWFLFIMAALLVLIKVFLKKGYKAAEGSLILFGTLAGFGIVLWLGWNQLIFKDALYFAFGPYSARAQQDQLAAANNLATKGDLLLSIQIYFYSLFYNIGVFNAILGFLGMIIFWLDKKISNGIKLMSLSLLAPLLFNVLALFLGFSVLFIQGISGNTWFNVRYGIMMIPFIAICIGYLIHKVSSLKYVLIGLLIFTVFFSLTSFDAVTIDDARVGSSQKNVTEVSSWLSKNTKEKEGFVLISAASHDAIIFSSRLPMKKFIHEGTGKYWKKATTKPEYWARWIIVRTNDKNDSTWKLITQTSGFPSKYQLKGKYPFADIYELKKEYLSTLNTTASLGPQR